MIKQIKLFVDGKQEDCKNLSEKISDKTIYSVNSCKNIHECQEVFKSKEIYQQNIFNNQQKLSDLFDEKIKENEKLREDNNRFKIEIQEINKGFSIERSNLKQEITSLHNELNKIQVDYKIKSSETETLIIGLNSLREKVESQKKRNRPNFHFIRKK